MMATVTGYRQTQAGGSVTQTEVIRRQREQQIPDPAILRQLRVMSGSRSMETGGHLIRMAIWVPDGSLIRFTETGSTWMPTPE